MVARWMTRLGAGLVSLSVFICVAAPAARAGGTRIPDIVAALPASPSPSSPAGRPPPSSGTEAFGATPERAGDGAAIDRILANVSRRGGDETRFVEQRYLPFLEAPVESSGRLRYQPPARLERITEQPKPETMVLDGDMLSMTRDGRTRSLGISQLPAVGALVGSIRDLLAGDRAALERRYRLIAQGDAGHWQLVLLPLDSELAALVTRIVVAGRADRLETIEILQGDGDRSVMTLGAATRTPS